MAYRVQFNVLVDGAPVPGERYREEVIQSWAATKKAMSEHGIKVWPLPAPRPGEWHYYSPVSTRVGVARYLSCGVRVYRDL